MNTKSLVKTVMTAIALVGIWVDFAEGDKLQLQEKLGKDIKTQLRDVTIAEALEKIGKEAGVKFVLSDDASWKLPQGEATRLSVMLDGPLAESMTDMLNAFFMRYAVGDEEITIYPRPELDHILGRPTAKQLELLKAIYTRATEQYLESLQNTVSQAIGEHVAIVPTEAYGYLDKALHELSYQDFIDDSRPEGYKFKLIGPMTVANMLQHGVVPRPRREGGVRKMWMEKGQWYLSNAQFPHSVAEIRLLNEPDFREAKLDQIVDVYTQGDAAAIIQRLANWSGMELHWAKRDPFWPGGGNMLVDMQNVKLGQAIRNIAAIVDGYAGINIEENEIVIEGPVHGEEKAAQETAERKGADYVGKISIPMNGGSYYIEFMLREKDLTDELKKLWQKKMKEILKVPSLYELRPEEESPKPAQRPQKMEEVY